MLDAAPAIHLFPATAAPARLASPARLSPPAIEQPAPRQVSYGLVSGRAGGGTRWVIVSANGEPLATKPLRGRRFALSVALPGGPLRVRVTTVAASGASSSAVVRDVFGLPRAAEPRAVAPRNDPLLARDLRELKRRYRGIASFYVQSLTSGHGAAANARARFPAASTVKLGIAAAVLARHSGIPPPRSRVGRLLREMITVSDDEAANELLVWLGGSTVAGGALVNALMRSLGLADTAMYGGYLVPRLAGQIPVEVERSPAFGSGKYTTAWDMAALWRALWLASANRGPLRAVRPGLAAAEARHLLWLAAHATDAPKLARVEHGRPDVHVLHKAGWISTARHDTGLVFWPGGVFVASVLTWKADGAGAGSDRLAALVARTALARFRRGGR